jgi:hypothetical protein
MNSTPFLRRARPALLGLLLAAPALPALARPPAAVGAPLVCFPIAVADESLLPFEPGGNDGKPKVALEALPATLASLFAQHDDALLHLEAIRRASFAYEGRGPNQRDATPHAGLADWDELLARLDSALVASLLLPDSDPQATARRARAWFDVGYAREVGKTMGLCTARGLDCLEKAVALRPDDAALRFGAAMAAYQHECMESYVAGAGGGARKDASATWRNHLAHALAAPSPLSPLLQKNLLSTFGAFLGCTSDEQLRAAVRGERRDG